MTLCEFKKYDVPIMSECQFKRTQINDNMNEKSFLNENGEN